MTWCNKIFEESEQRRQLWMDRIVNIYCWSLGKLFYIEIFSIYMNHILLIKDESKDVFTTPLDRIILRLKG